jgi:SAM-dependent methyltransferase/glycosyltransferase involved in cell wall biosynthesis
MAEHEQPTPSPSISVIISGATNGPALTAALESALAQGRADFEIIVQGHPSGDGQAAGDSRVRWLGADYGDLTALRNGAAAVSRGTYLIFLDAHERLRPLALDAGLACFAAHPEAALVYGGYQPTDDQGTAAGAPVVPRDYSQHYRALLANGTLPLGAAMIRREVFEQVGGFGPLPAAASGRELILRIARAYPLAVHDLVVAEGRAGEPWDRPESAADLVTALDVQEQQRPFFEKDRALSRAARAGFTALKKRYLAALIRSLAARLRGRTVAHPVGDALKVLGRHLPFLVWHGAKPLVRRLTAAVIPDSVARKIRAGFERTPLGRVRFGQLRRLTPFSRAFGYDCGQPVDRYYIEDFLARRSHDIRGRVLEVGDNSYSLGYGGERVTQSDVLHVKEGNPKATIIGDLTTADHIPSDTFDCIVLTQTLQLIYDVRAALRTLYRILKPGGVLLVTVPGITQISDAEWGGIWCWSFTPHSIRRLFAEHFPEPLITIEAHGNVLAATAFLYGLPIHHLKEWELDHHDPDYPMLITVRATKPRAGD